MKPSIFTCVQLAAFCLCQIGTSFGESTKFSQINENNCFCPGAEIVFQCTTVGIGSTRYIVTGCNEDALNLLHTGFADRSSFRSCNSALGVVVEAQGVSASAGMSYTSNLTIQTIPTMDITVSCYYDDGADPPNLTFIGAHVITPAVPEPVSNIRLISDNSNLHITWNKSPVPQDCDVEYLVSTVDCGNCVGRPMNTFVDCDNDQSETQRSCTVSVSVRLSICGISGNATTEVFSISPITSNSPTASGLNTPSGPELSDGATIAITVCVLFGVIGVTVLAAVVTLMLCLWNKRDIGHSQLKTGQELVNRFDIFEARYSKMFNEIKEKEGIIEENKTQIREKEKLLENAKLERQQSEDKVQELTTQIDELEKKAVLERQRSEEVVKELKKEICELRSQNETLTKEVSTLIKTLKEEQDQRNEELKNLKISKAPTEDIKKLQQQITALQERFQDQNGEVVASVQESVIGARLHEVTVAEVNDTMNLGTIYSDEQITFIAPSAQRPMDEEKLVALCVKGTGDISEFQDLLSQPGVEPNLRDKDGRTLLSLASSQGRTDLVQLLLDHGADVDLPDDTEWGSTALIRACAEGHGATADLLINKGATVNYLDKKGHHALGVASIYGRLNCVKLLLLHKAQIDLPYDDDLGFTALMNACQNSHTDVAYVLIEKGAMVEYHNKEGATPLIMASQEGHIEVVQLLIDRGAHVDHPNKTGKTPLHNACDKGHKDVAVIFIENGAQLDIEDEDGCTPLMVAKRRGWHDIVKILTDAEFEVVGDRGTKEGLLASETDTSLRESCTPSEEVLSQLVKENDLSVEASSHPPKVVDPPGPVLTQSPKESRTHGEETSPHSPQDTTSTAATEIEYDFVEQPPKEFFCPVTFELLLSPYLTTCCGNHMSETAVKRLKRENMPCPICKEPELFTFLDKYYRRRVREVRVHCPHKFGGCGWVGEVGVLQSHMDSCLKRHDTSDTACLPVESP